MKDIEVYKKALEEERERLIAGLSSVGRRNPSNPKDWEAVPDETGQAPDILDAGEIIEGFGQNAAILSDLEARYQLVLEALQRIQDGTYGACSVCGVEIETDRLSAEPAATTCKAHLIP